jgi:hypothetical protein
VKQQFGYVIIIIKKEIMCSSKLACASKEKKGSFAYYCGAKGYLLQTKSCTL